MNDNLSGYLSGISSILTIVASIVSFVKENSFYISIGLSVIGVISLILFLRIIVRMYIVGLINVYPQEKNNKKHHDKLEKKIKNASEIRLFFTTGRGFFGNNKDALSWAIRHNNASIKALLGEKGSQFLTDISDVEILDGKRPETDNIHDEVYDVYRTSISEIRANQSDSQKGNLAIKYYKTEFRTSMILIKDKSNQKWGWITLTLPPLKAVKTVSFEIICKKDTDDNIYSQCEYHFDRIWAKIADVK